MRRMAQKNHNFQPGVILHEVIRGFDYAETAAVLLIIIVCVTLIDILSSRVRQWAI